MTTQENPDSLLTAREAPPVPSNAQGGNEMSTEAICTEPNCPTCNDPTREHAPSPDAITLTQVTAAVWRLHQLVPAHWWTTPPNQATTDVLQGIRALENVLGPRVVDVGQVVIELPCATCGGPSNVDTDPDNWQADKMSVSECPRCGYPDPDV